MPRARRVLQGGRSRSGSPPWWPCRRDPRLQGDVALVHGGGRQGGADAAAAWHQSRFNGRRETSPARWRRGDGPLGIDEQGAPPAFSRPGCRLIGISGRDGGLIAGLVPDLGVVGSDHVNPWRFSEALWAGSSCRDRACLSGPSGEAVNVNADEAARGDRAPDRRGDPGFLSDVDGVILDGASVAHLTEAQIEARIADGSITGDGHEGAHGPRCGALGYPRRHHRGPRPNSRAVSLERVSIK